MTLHQVNTIGFYGFWSSFNRIPNEIFVNRNWSCRPNEPHVLKRPSTFESLKSALEYGPFVAFSAVGPTCYEIAPKLFTGLIDTSLEFYGWYKEALRVRCKAVSIK